MTARFDDLRPNPMGETGRSDRGSWYRMTGPDNILKYLEWRLKHAPLLRSFVRISSLALADIRASKREPSILATSDPESNYVPASLAKNTMLQGDFRNHRSQKFGNVAVRKPPNIWSE